MPKITRNDIKTIDKLPDYTHKYLVTMYGCGFHDGERFIYARSAQEAVGIVKAFLGYASAPTGTMQHKNDKDEAVRDNFHGQFDKIGLRGAYAVRLKLRKGQDVPMPAVPKTSTRTKKTA